MIRVRPKIVVRNLSPNQSERESGIRGIVIHDTESHNYRGTRDLESVGQVFQEGSASAHVCTDADGLSGRYVPDSRKAWHCRAYNSQTLGIEQIGFAAQGRRTWLRHRRQLRETARWIAEWSIRWKIPIRRGEVSRGRVTKTGVLTHNQLGALGGGHRDPGVYPMGHVLWLARGFKAIRRGRL